MMFCYEGDMMATIPDGLQRSRLLCYCRAKRSKTSAFHCRSATVQTRYCTQSCYRNSVISAANETLLSKMQRSSSGCSSGCSRSVNWSETTSMRNFRILLLPWWLRPWAALFIRKRSFWSLGWPGLDFHWFSIKFLLATDHFQRPWLAGARFSLIFN